MPTRLTISMLLVVVLPNCTLGQFHIRFYDAQDQYCFEISDSDIEKVDWKNQAFYVSESGLKHLENESCAFDHFILALNDSILYTGPMQAAELSSISLTHPVMFFSDDLLFIDEYLRFAILYKGEGEDKRFNIGLYSYLMDLHKIDSQNHQIDTTYQLNLKKIENLLNTEIPYHEFGNYDGVPIDYSITDLTDPLNIGNELGSDDVVFIKFITGHFYHVVPVFEYMSYSFIIYMDNERTKIFKSVNCNKKGNSLKDVIKFASKKLEADKNKKAIIRRIKNYRSSLRFVTPMDNYGTGKPKCD